MLPGIVEHARHVRLAVRQLHDLVKRFALKLRVLLDEAVQRGDVRLMVLAMMQLQRFLAHAAAGERVFGVGKFREFESHGRVLRLVRGEAVVSMTSSYDPRRGASSWRPAMSPMAALVRRHDPDRFLTALFAPADKREALLTLYAFNHELARAREAVSQPMLALMRLQWWREVIEGARRGHEVATPLAALLDAGVLDRGELLGLIEAREIEAEPFIATLGEWRWVSARLGGRAGGGGGAAARRAGAGGAAAAGGGIWRGGRAAQRAGAGAAGALPAAG